MEIVVTSLPDQDVFIAELYLDNEGVATLIEGAKPGEVVVELYAKKNGQANVVDYHELIIGLVTAHKRLAGFFERNAHDADGGKAAL